MSDIWYPVLLGSDLRRGGEIHRRVLGRVLILKRDEIGRVGGYWDGGLDEDCRAWALERQGLIWLWAINTQRTPDHEPPAFEGMVGGTPKLVDSMVFNTHLDHAIAGLMDPAHGAYVHRQGWWRRPDRPQEQTRMFEPRPFGFAMVRHPPSINARALATLGANPSTEITFRLPGLRWEHVLVGRHQILALTCLTPIDGQQTQVLQIIWSDHPLARLLAPLIGMAARRVLRQDAAIIAVQSQGLKHDPPLLWVDDADVQAQWYFELKAAWAHSRRQDAPFQNPVKPATLRWCS